MAIDEARRHELHESARRMLGIESGDTLMEMLPPVGWADVATKRDFDGLAAATKRDFDGLAAATKRDLDGLAAATKRDLDGLAAATKRDLETTEIRLTSAINDAVRGSEHRILVWMFTTVLTAVLGGTAISVAVALSV